MHTQGAHSAAMMLLYTHGKLTRVVAQEHAGAIVTRRSLQSVLLSARRASPHTCIPVLIAFFFLPFFSFLRRHLSTSYNHSEYHFWPHLWKLAPRAMSVCVCILSEATFYTSLFSGPAKERPGIRGLQSRKNEAGGAKMNVSNTLLSEFSSINAKSCHGSFITVSVVISNAKCS